MLALNVMVGKIIHSPLRCAYSVHHGENGKQRNSMLCLFPSLRMFDWMFIYTKYYGIPQAPPSYSKLCGAKTNYFALMYSSMLFAAVLPAPIARITVAAPVTASPPA